MNHGRWGMLFGLFASLAVSGCGDAGDVPPEQDPDEITGANAVARNVTLSGVVYLRTGATASEILDAVKHQNRTFFGPLRNVRVGLDDREFARIDPQTFVRDTVTVVDTEHPGAATTQMLRVRYTYQDHAVVTNDLSTRRTLNTTALVGNYESHANDIITACTDDPEAREFGAGGLWYMFNPTMSSCQARIRAEVQSLDAAQRKLTDRQHQVSLLETQRWFLPVAAKLAAIRGPTTPRYPEYDQLLGVRDASKTSLNMYGFFGVIAEREGDPRDEGYLEMMRVLRNVTRAHPEARWADPTLLNVRVNGTALTGVTYARVLDWAIDGSAPSGVSITALRQAIQDLWKTKTITVTLPITVTSRGTSRPIDVNLKVYYGDEGSAWSQQARARYIAAWRDADVFIYSGHSHLGSGPLDPSNYDSSDFPDRYQIMMINSCVSYNYYNRDFYPMHPGGSRKLDMIVNGTEALGDNGYSVTALIQGLISGRQMNYLQLMQSMVVTDPSIGLDHYDPLRVTDGETDNTYTPTATPITVSVRR